jgi:CheY-like chemotaxis protein
MLKRQLEVLGLDADTAASGREALGKWLGYGHDVVVTDCQMPEMDGYSLARAIRAEALGRSAVQPTIVAFTANTHPEALEACRKAGMDEYLSKPAELAALRAVLTRCLRSTQPVPTAASTRAPRPGVAETEALIDLARVREFVVGEEGVAEVVQEFRASTEDDVVTLRACLARNDASEAGRAAHRIKGGAAAMGASRIAEAAAEVERAAGRKDLIQVAAHAEALMKELEKLWKAVEGVEDFDAVGR